MPAPCGPRVTWSSAVPSCFPRSGAECLLADRLLRKRQPVQVANEVQARVVNFPSVTDLGFALNPASRLFGGRAVPRGPAFTVELDYRSGAEDVISARVASRLLEENAAQGLWPGAEL